MSRFMACPDGTLNFDPMEKTGMKDYLKTYASIFALFGLVLTMVAAFAFNIYLNSRNNFVESEKLKFNSAVLIVERDVDDLKTQLDGSVLGLDRNSSNGLFSFFMRGGDLMAKHSLMAEREIVIQSDGTEPFYASIRNFIPSEYVLTNSRGERISSQAKTHKFLNDNELLAALEKRPVSESGYFIVSSSGKFQGSDFNYKNFLTSNILVWKNKVSGSDLTLSHAAVYPGFLPVFFNVLFFAGLLCLPFVLVLFVVRRRVTMAYAEISNWVQATSVSLRYGRPVALPSTKSIRRQSLPLLNSIQEALSKSTPLLSYVNADYISQEFNLVTWNHFKKTISLWLCGQQRDFDVENGKDWLVCSISAVRDSVLDTFVREANGALLSKKMFIYQYSDSTIVLALKVVDFDESLERVKALVKNAASREAFGAHDIVVDVVYGTQSTSTFGEWFAFFESKIRKPVVDNTQALINTEIARFYMYSSREKVLSLNWIQLMAGVRNWLQLKAPTEADLNQRGPAGVLRPRKFARPHLVKPGKVASAQ